MRRVVESHGTRKRKRKKERERERESESEREREDYSLLSFVESIKRKRAKIYFGIEKLKNL